MKVLVLGGTGAMGEHLVQILSKNGIETFVTSRTNFYTEGQIHYIQGNAHDIAFLQTILCEHWDAIVDFMSYSTKQFKERFKLLLEATSHYIFLSSARVYADARQFITETSSRLLDVSTDKEFLTTDEYSLAKARQENILINSKQKNWSIIRPYITYSENRLQLGVLEKEQWLYRALHGRTIVFSKDILTRITTLTYGLDVSRGIAAIIGNNNTLGETFHITSKETQNWQYILSIYIDVLEKHLGFKPNVLLEDLEEFTEIHPEKHQILYDRLFNRQFDNSKISQYIDVNSFTKLGSGLNRCLKEFLCNPKFRDISWKYEALKDRQTKEYTPIAEIKGAKQKIVYLVYRFLPLK